MLSVATIIIIVVIASVVGISLIALLMGIKVVPQSNCYILERLGRFKTIWSTGLHLRLPLIDRIARRISLKEQVVNFEPQTVITSDNVTMKIDTVLFYMITDPKAYTYGVQNPIFAIENLTATTLRNEIGNIELDRTLTSREQINTKLQSTLDEASAAWGIKVVRVEVKNILPPLDVRNAMEKQMRAEREKRANILNAEGFKRAKILEAEGIGEATYKKALGKARALLIGQKALAKSITIVNEAKPSPATIKLRSFSTLAQVANGKSTKIIIPSNLQNLSSIAATLGTVGKAALSETDAKDSSQNNAAFDDSLFSDIDNDLELNPDDTIDSNRAYTSPTGITDGENDISATSGDSIEIDPEAA